MQAPLSADDTRVALAEAAYHEVSATHDWHGREEPAGENVSIGHITHTWFSLEKSAPKAHPNPASHIIVHAAEVVPGRVLFTLT
jgi:hypothetical protein